MAIRGEVKFKGIKGPRKDESSIIYAFSNQGSLAMDKYSGMPTGSRTYEPFEIVKEIDRSTPELWQAMTRGQILDTVEITLYEIAKETGIESPYFKFTLMKARISSIKDYMPSTFEQSGNIVGHLEQVYMIANEYQWEHLTESTQYVDNNFFNKV